MRSEDYIVLVLLSIMYSLPLLASINHLILIYKRWRYGKETTAEIINTYSKIGHKRNITHWMQYSFIHDETEIYIHKLVTNYVQGALFHDLTEIIMEYIGYNSILFYYGPYESECTYDPTEYQPIIQGDVNILYDTTNPYNLALIGMQKFGYWKEFAGFIIPWFFMAWFTFLYFMWDSMIGLIFGVLFAVIQPPLCLWVDCSMYKLCCYKQHHQLQIELQCE